MVAQTDGKRDGSGTRERLEREREGRERSERTEASERKRAGLEI